MVKNYLIVQVLNKNNIYRLLKYIFKSDIKFNRLEVEKEKFFWYIY
jgi:hypothetical protein